MASSINIPTGPLAAKTDAARPSSSCSSTHSQVASSPGSSRSDKTKFLHQRRPSLLSSSISKQEATVINIGGPDGPPRLISYLSSSQGFIWNPEIFLPSYIDYDYTPLENRPEPVHEISLSDEEIQAMFPQ